MRGLLVVLLVPAMLAGCNGGAALAPEDIVKGIKVAAKGAARYGLQYAMDKEPAKADEIAKNAQLAVEIIRKNVLPVFAGASTADVLRSAVEKALEELGSKLKPQVLSAIQLAIDVLSTRVNLPENPADKLDPQTKAAIAAFFEGAADGIDGALSAIGKRDIGPPKLAWPKKA